MKLFVSFLVCVSWWSVCSASTAESQVHPGVLINNENSLRNKLGLSTDFKLVVEQSRPTGTGLMRHKLRILFKKVPLRAFTLQATATQAGKYTGAVSGRLPNITADFDVKATVKGKSELKNITVEFVNSNVTGNKHASINITKADLVKFEYRKEILMLSEDKPVLVQSIKALVDMPAHVRNPRLLVDALNGTVIKGSDKLRFESGDLNRSRSDYCPVNTGGNRKIGQIPYGPNATTLCLNAAVFGDICKYQSKMVQVYTVGNTWNRSSAEIVSFNCSEGLNDAINEANSPASDAFYLAQIFDPFMREVGGVAQTTVGGFPHAIYVHFGVDYNNAFYDGYTSTFGDGDDEKFPLVVAEALAHELCHAFSDSMGNLNYEKETLVIDESFSDICGKAFSAYLGSKTIAAHLGYTGATNWSFAAGLIKGEDEAMRWFDEPSKNEYFVDNMKDVPADEPYKAMGVFAKLYYLLVQEYHIGHKNAFELFVFANTIYWHEETNFQDAACSIMLSASDLGLIVANVSSALDAVGFNSTTCLISGTVDVLTKKIPNRENVQVSQVKNPQVHIRVPNGKIGGNVTVLNTDRNITLTMAGVSRTDTLSFNGTGDQILTLSGDSQVGVAANFTVDFYGQREQRRSFERRSADFQKFNNSADFRKFNYTL